MRLNFPLPSKILIYLESLKKKYVKNKNIVWHIATPRSASTALMEYLRNNYADTAFLIPTLPFEKNRFQNICINTIFNKIFLRGCSFYITQHVHTLLSNDLENIINKNHLVIIQYRKIEETIESLFYYLKDVENFWLPYVNKYSFSDNNIITELIYNYVPWHVNFLKGWILNEKNNFDKIIINYDEIIKDSSIVTKRISEKIFDKYTSSMRSDIYSNLSKNLEIVNKGIHDNKKNTLLNLKHKMLIKEILEGNLTKSELQKLKTI